MRSLLLPATALALVACSSAPKRSYSSPEAAAAAVVSALDEGRGGDARAAFEAYARSDSERERLYPELFDVARTRFEGGDAGGAADVLGFLTDQYPDAVAASEARVYALFLERAERGAAPGEVDADLSEEIDEALSELRSRTSRPAPLVELVETQQHIDGGRLADARASLGGFLGRWRGEPAALLPYVEDLDRYLASH